MAEPIDTQVYAVFAKGINGNSLLGYVISESWEDIEAYYDHKKGYGLEVEAVHPIRIPRGYAKTHGELVAKRNRLEKELEDINRKIQSGKP